MTRFATTIASIFLTASAVPAADPPRVVRENSEWLDVWGRGTR